MPGSQDTDPVVRERMTSLQRSFSQLGAKVGRIPAMPSADELTPGLRSDVESFNTGRASLVSRFRDIAKPILEAITSISNLGITENQNLVDLHSTIEITKSDRLMFLEEAARTATAGQELASRVVSEFDPIAKDLEAEYEKTVDTVKEDLERIGQGVSATRPAIISGGNGGEAGERVFTILAKDNNRSRVAFEAANVAKNKLATATQAVLACGKASEEIRTELSLLAMSEIRI